MTSDGTTWMLPLASTSVFILQLALQPRFSVPAAAAVAAVYVAAVPHPTGAWFLILQAVVTAVLMTLLRKGGRGADAVIAAALRSEQEIRAEAARRIDEREQHRQLHDTLLSTLTMIATGTFSGQSAVVCAQAEDDLEVLRTLRAAPVDDPARAGNLCARIGDLAAQAAPLRVRLVRTQVNLPVAVTDYIAGSVAEALRNVARHAQVDDALAAVQGGDGWVRVQVCDQGAGFDPESVPPSRRGVRESIVGRMSAVGGTAEVTSRPGAGTTVFLRWPG
jgi:signal transduction histidine kinase